MKSEAVFKKSAIGLIPEDWEVKEMNKICEVTSSKRIFLADYVAEGIPFYRSKEIIEKAQGIKISAETFISKKKFDEIKEKYGAPQKGDLLLSSVGVRSGIPYYVNEKKEFYFKDGNLVWFRNFKNNILSKYLYFILVSEIGQNQLRNSMIGSAQPALTIEGLNKLVVPIPPISEQEAIAKILSDFDSKIEINQQMNINLEKTGQALFKRWFIDFEFPNEKGEPYKSSGGEMVDSELGEMPKGWEITQDIQKLCEKVNYGYTQSASEEEIGPKFLRVTDINKGDWIDWQNVPYCKIDEKDLHKYILEKGDIVIARMADPGKVAIYESDVKAVFASYLIRIGLKNKKYSYYLYYLMKSRYYQEYIMGAASGSVQKSLNAQGLTKGLPVIIPDVKTIDNFNKIVGSLREKLNENVIENESLGKIRDSLLPRLMSGKIRVTGS